MSTKVLKLVGLKTYTNGVTGSVPLKKGDSARFDASVADQMLEGGRKNAEHEIVHYFQEQPEGAKFDFDFSSETAKNVPEEVVIAPAAKTPVRAPQRATRATAR